MEEKSAFVNEPVVLTDEHYQHKIDYESDEDCDVYTYTLARWVKIDNPSPCRCGRLTCRICGSAFDWWFTDQLRKVIDKRQQSFTVLTLEIPMAIKNDERYFTHETLGTFNKIMTAKLAKLSISDSPWFGVIDVTLASYNRKKPMGVWYPHMLLVTRVMAEAEIVQLQEQLGRTTLIKATRYDWPLNEAALGGSPDAVFPKQYADHQFYLFFYMSWTTGPMWQLQSPFLDRSRQSQRLMLFNASCRNNVIDLGPSTT